MKTVLRVLWVVADCVGTISDFFENFRFYRLSRLFHQCYNALDGLHWALMRRYR